MAIDLEKIELGDFITDHPQDRQDIDTQIDRLAAEFQKNASSEESH